MNLFDVLEINSNSNINEIRKAYHRLLLKYHPDKNKSKESKEKLEEIKLAYEILSNAETRKKYSMLNEDKTNKLWWILQGLSRNVSGKDLSSLLNSDNYQNLEEFFEIFENLTLNDILSWFYKPSNLPKPYLDEHIDSETNTWDMDNCLKLYQLPVKFLSEKDCDIKIVITSSLSDILNKNIKKFKINRQINDILKVSNFVVSLEYPFIIFPNAGDINKNKYGNLIFINTIPGWTWDENNLIMEKQINLYQMLYGLDIKLNLGNTTDTINYLNYIPHRDGWEIIILKLDNINIKIKLVLEDLSEEKQQVLFSLCN